MSKFFTTFYSNVKNLPGEIVPISIAGKCPDGWSGLEFKVLAPKKAFFMEWKRNGDNGFYIQHFHDEVLSRLDPDAVWNRLLELSGGRPFALCCYEKPGDFCHRHLVSEWLREAGHEIDEWSEEPSEEPLF